MAPGHLKLWVGGPAGHPKICGDKSILALGFTGYVLIKTFTASGPPKDPFSHLDICSGGPAGHPRKKFRASPEDLSKISHCPKVSQICVTNFNDLN